MITEGNLPFEKLKKHYDKAEKMRGEERYSEAIEEWYSVLDLIEGRRPEFAEELAALGKEGVAMWKIIAYGGLGKNRLMIGSLSQDLESRKEHYLSAVEAYENSLEDTWDLEGADLNVSIGYIISSYAGLILMAKEDDTANCLFDSAKIVLDGWWEGLVGPRPEDEEKRKRLILELDFNLVLCGELTDPAKCIDMLTAISRDMTLEHAEFPGDVSYTLGLLYHQEARRSKLPSQKLSSLIKAKRCYKMAAQCYPEAMHTKKYAAQMKKEKISNEIKMLQKPDDGVFRLETKQLVDDYMRNAERNPLEGMLCLLDLRDMCSGFMPVCEMAYIKAHLAEVDCLLPGYRSNGLKLARELKDSEWLTEEQREKMKTLAAEKDG